MFVAIHSRCATEIDATRHDPQNRSSVGSLLPGRFPKGAGLTRDIGELGQSEEQRKKPWSGNPDLEFFGDGRPYWEKMDPSQGLPIWEALFHFVDPRLAVHLYDLDLSGYGDESNIDPLWWPEERAEFDKNAFLHGQSWRTLEHDLRWKLIDGELTAYGFSNQAPLDSPRRPIAPERWRDLDPDLKRSTASGPGIEVTQILVFRTNAEPVSPAQQIKGYSEAELRRWYVNRIDEHNKLGEPPSRTEDYQAAKTAFGAGVGRRAVESLRRELAPDAWTRRGRRRSRS